MLIGANLHFDVSPANHHRFDEEGAVAESRERLGLRGPISLGQILVELREVQA